MSFRDGAAFARDDVAGTELLLDLVVQARLEEMTYFKKLGVYKIVPRAHQRRSDNWFSLGGYQQREHTVSELSVEVGRLLVERRARRCTLRLHSSA